MQNAALCLSERNLKKLLLFLVATFAVLAGIGWWYSHSRQVTLAENTFTYASLEKGPMREMVSATGILEPRDPVVVSSEMPGTVLAVQARVNDEVREGQVLLQLEDRKEKLKLRETEDGLNSAQAMVQQAEAVLFAARLGLKYQEDLQDKAGLRVERDRADAEVQAATAGVQAARFRLEMAKTLCEQAALALERTQVRVPKGVHGQTYHVLERKVQPGQMVGPLGSPLFTLAGDLHHIEVHAQVAEGDIGKVKKGLATTFTVTAFSDEDVEFRGKVREIWPLPTTVKGAVFYDTIIDVVNQKDPHTGEWRLRPGMTAAVDIMRREHTEAWKVPSSALNFQLHENYQSDAIRQRLAEWRDRTDASLWRPLWVWDPKEGGPWPVFVRVGGLNAAGDPGLKDAEFNEILEWEPGREPDPRAPLPRVIINAPPVRTGGFLDRPANIKIS